MKRPRSESPDMLYVAKKRFSNEELKENEFKSVTPSTPYQKSNSLINWRFKIQPQEKMILKDNLFVYDLWELNFEEDHKKLDKILKLVCEKKKIRDRLNIELSKDEIIRIKIIDEYNKLGRKYCTIAKNLHIRRQQVRNVIKHFEENNNLFASKRGRKSKITKEIEIFIKNWIANDHNIGKTIDDLNNSIHIKFNFEPHSLNNSSLYRFLERRNFVCNKIIWKKNQDNSNRTKNLRVILAEKLLRIFLSEGYPIFIDECSFNINLRPAFFWTKRGKKIYALREPKSVNYSLLASMSYDGMLGWMIFKGSVKKEDFFSYLNYILIKEKQTLEGKKVVFFMDNAKIHKSKAYMDKIFNKFNTVLYNAPYSPQLNPIEFAFSKIKRNVRKAKPNDERNLILAINQSIMQIMKRNSLMYIYKAFKNLLPAHRKEDLY